MKFAVVGVGKMGGAILKGIINKQIFNKEDILLIVHREEQLNELKSQGFNVSLNVEDSYNAEVILLSIKPQMFKDAFATSVNFDFTGKVILSIAAGKDINTLKAMFKGGDVVRAMPNTSALINESVTTICAENKNDSYYRAKEIIDSIGVSVEINEDQMDATLPLNGSMPAYIYYFIKSFIDSAVKSGIKYEDAKSLCVNTIISASKMLLTTDEDLQVLINNVCSKGGTTIAGLNKLTDAGVAYSISECYNACKNRSKELNEK